MDASIKDFMSIREASETLNVHENTIRNYIKGDQLPNTYRNGNIVLVYRPEVLALLDTTPDKETA